MPGFLVADTLSALSFPISYPRGYPLHTPGFWRLTSVVYNVTSWSPSAGEVQQRVAAAFGGATA